MNKTINIGVEELEDVVAGVDIAGGNLEFEAHEVPEGVRVFDDFVSSTSPLPVAAGHYDHVIYTRAWMWTADNNKQEVADEFYRILSKGGTVFIRDYLAITDWELTGGEIPITLDMWLDRLACCFSKDTWAYSEHKLIDNDYVIEITLTKK